jgi:hypothetical protein
MKYFITNAKQLLSSRSVKILLLLLLVFQIAKIHYQVLGADAGAILPAARDVIRYGSIPYISLYTIYTPLSYYLYGILYLFSEIPGMQMVMYYNCLFILLSGFIFWRTCPHSPSRDSIVLLYLLSVSPLLFDVKIETMGLPLLALFALESSKILDRTSPFQAKRALFRSSVLIGILFLFKQYYLILFPMTGILFMIGSGRSILTTLKTILLSFAILSITISIIFLLILRFDLTDVNPDLFMRHSNNSTPIAALYHYARYTLLLYPYLIGVPALIIFCRSIKEKILWSLFLLTPCVLFSFNINPHYMFLFAPYLLILFTLVGLKDDFIASYFTLNPVRVNILLMAFLISGSFYILRNHLYADTLYIMQYKNTRKSYMESEAELARIQTSIGQNKKIYLGDGMNKMFIYRLGLESINAKEIGYIFLYNSCLDTAFARYASYDSKLFRAEDLKNDNSHD